MLADADAKKPPGARMSVAVGAFEGGLKSAKKQQEPKQCLDFAA